MHSDHRLAVAEPPPPGCSSCSMPGCSQQLAEVECSSPEPENPRPMTGWSFAAASVGMFLLPGLAAIAGAILGRGTLGGQLAGGVIGLALAMGGCVLFAKLFWKEETS